MLKDLKKKKNNNNFFLKKDHTVFHFHTILSHDACIIDFIYIGLLTFH